MKRLIKQTATFIVPLSLGLFLAQSAMACDNAQQAKSEFNAAMQQAKQKNHSNAVSHFDQSLTFCPGNFMVHYQYANSLTALRKFSEAKQHFNKAMQVAGSDSFYGKALAGEAKVLAVEGKLLLASRKLKEAGHFSKELWIAELLKRVNAKLSETQLSSAELLRSINAPTRMMGEMAGIDLYIHFDTGLASLSEIGQFEIDQLAQVLEDESLEGKSFKIIGHADMRGSDARNQTLSESRAQTVLSELIKTNPQLKNRIRAMGKGESQPLCEGSDDLALKCNRRVELMVE